MLGDSVRILLATGTRITQQYKNSFGYWDQNSPAICCTCLHSLHKYRSGLLNTPGGGIITSLFMVRRLLGDNGISLLMSLRDSSVRGLELTL